MSTVSWVTSRCRSGALNSLPRRLRVTQQAYSLRHETELSAHLPPLPADLQTCKLLQAHDVYGRPHTTLGGRTLKYISLLSTHRSKCPNKTALARVSVVQRSVSMGSRRGGDRPTCTSSRCVAHVARTHDVAHSLICLDRNAIDSSNAS